MRFRKSIAILILCGTLLTFSTLAPFNVAFCLLVMFMTGGSGGAVKKLVILLLVGAVVSIGVYELFLALSDTSLGIGRKLASASASDRLRSVREGLDFVMSHPFGSGFYNGNAAINFVAALSELACQARWDLACVVGYAIAGFPPCLGSGPHVNADFDHDAFQ